MFYVYKQNISKRKHKEKICLWIMNSILPFLPVICSNDDDNELKKKKKTDICVKKNITTIFFLFFGNQTMNAMVFLILPGMILWFIYLHRHKILYFKEKKRNRAHIKFRIITKKSALRLCIHSFIYLFFLLILSSIRSSLFSIASLIIWCLLLWVNLDMWLINIFQSINWAKCRWFFFFFHFY